MTRKEWDALNNEGKKADLLKGCGDGYGQGRHEYDEKTCPKCGAVFCWNCCASTNVHHGGKHEPDYMLCPVCGHDYYEEDMSMNRTARQMTAEETAVFIEEYSERLCIERLGYTPAVWYQGGGEHNDDRLVADVMADGDIRVTDGIETQIYSGSRTPDEVRRFVRDWLENLWEERV